MTKLKQHSGSEYENTDIEEEVQKIGAEEPSSVYKTRSIARQKVVMPYFNEGDDSSANGSSSGDVGSGSEDESGNEATSSSAEESWPMRGEVLKAKTSVFRDSLCLQLKEAEEYFREAILEDLCKKGQQPVEMRIKLHIQARGEVVDILEATLTRMLYRKTLHHQKALHSLCTK
ncbi:hypothetical protein HAX54_007945 [Datura stramonium]|uniref:Uncharacterized protein n=1 Tax=Datura stramonium TaxID=4076 RepID=A0ABS8TE07_DATST|nr:hypothetical protein [Datura stramonium]